MPPIGYLIEKPYGPPERRRYAFSDQQSLDAIAQQAAIGSGFQPARPVDLPGSPRKARPTYFAGFFGTRCLLLSRGFALEPLPDPSLRTGWGPCPRPAAYGSAHRFAQGSN